MAIDSATSAPDPSWFTPERLLFFFCMINFLNYLDRGAIASNGVNGSRRSCSESGICSAGSGIQGDLNLNNFEDGVISSAFMVGLLVASPIFASLAKSVNPFRLIGVGLSVWTLAVAFCGLSFNFWSISISRMFVGVGEASFISLAAPFIASKAPESQPADWLAVFYACIPGGVAVGYVYGGLIGSLSWRWAFLIEALLMLPFAILGFIMKPLQLKGFSPDGRKVSSTAVLDRSEAQGTVGAVDESSKSSWFTFLKLFWRDIEELLADKVYVVNVLGYTAYNFVMGAYSYWGPKAGYNIYNMSNADYLFGGVTAVCGIFGTRAGGSILDRMDSTIPNAFKLLSFTALFGAAFCFAAFCFKSLYAFLAVFSVGQLLIFATQAPVNLVSLHTVKPSLSTMAMAISTVSIHIFGDVPSSTLVGLLQDHIKSWRATALILSSVLFLAAAIWSIGLFLHSVERYNEKEESENSAADPLLDKTIAADDCC